MVGEQTKTLQVAGSLEASSEHPLAKAIVEKTQQERIKLLQVTDFKAVEGQGVTANLDGQPAFVGSLKLAENEQLTEKLKEQAGKLQSEAKTVVYVGLGDEIVGLIAIQDTPKESSATAIAQLKARGLRTVMITGDNEQVAQAIAKEVGIDDVVAGVMPNQKSAVIESLQKNGKKVAFVGDGINDAPALTTADVGIAMGSGTDIAIESGSIVLVKNDLRGVVRALSISQKTFNRIKLNLFWALIYNVIGIPIAAGVFVGVGLTLSPEFAALAMAFSSVSVVTSSLLLNWTKIEDA